MRPTLQILADDLLGRVICLCHDKLSTLTHINGSSEKQASIAKFVPIPDDRLVGTHLAIAHRVGMLKWVHVRTSLTQSGSAYYSCA
jgi:hypothetical protein